MNFSLFRSILPVILFALAVPWEGQAQRQIRFGAPAGTSTGGGGGNMTNAGPSVVGMVPTYTDITGTQVTPTNTLSLEALELDGADLAGLLTNKLALSGGTLVGTLAVPAITLNGVSLETQLTNKVLKSGDTMTGTLTTTTLVSTSLRPRHGVLTHAGTVTLDFSTNTFQKLVISSNLTLAFTGLETNRTYQLTVVNSQATNCTYVLPSVVYLGYYPTNIVAGKTSRWWFDVDPQTNSIVYATYAEQQ